MVPAKSEAANGTFVGDAGKRRQPAKLQVKCSVFDIVEDAEATAHHKLPAAEHVPSESEAGGKIIVVGINESAIGSARIAGIQDSRRGVWKDGGLLAREKT